MAIQDTNLQSNRQHAVPQNIMDVEFKIIGDLTMRQFAYLMILGLLSYFNTQFMVGIFKWPLTIFFMVLGLALAFIPVQDRGLDVWLVNFIKSVYSPTQMVWRKTVALPSAFLYDSLNVMKQELITLAPTTSRRKLEEYLDYSHKTLPRDPLDIPEAEYIMKVRQMSQNTRGNSAPSQSTNNAVSETYTSSIAPRPISSFISQTAPQPKATPVVEKVTEPVTKEKSSVNFGSFVSKLESNIGSAIKNITTIPAKDAAVSPVTKAPVEEKPVTKVVAEEIKPPVRRVEYAEPINNVQVSTISSAAPVREASAPTPRRVTPVARTPQPIQRHMDSPIYSTLTPDRHSGRKFTSFLPEQGELILPIRGERMLKTSDQVKMEESLEEKTEKLQLLLNQIRHSNGQVPSSISSDDTSEEHQFVEEAPLEPTPIKPIPSKNDLVANMSIKGGKVTESIKDYKVEVEPIVNIPSIKNQVVEQPRPAFVPAPVISSNIDKAMAEVSKEALDQLTKRRESILNELSSLRSTNDPSIKDKVTSLQKTLQQVNAQYQQLKKQFQDVEHLSQAQSNLVAATTVKPRPASESTISNAPSLNKANTLWGFVKTDIGKPVTDIVVIVKNMRGEPVRATKTNALGQFTLTTPINNGKYNIEVSSNNKSGLLFDIISVEASGNVIPPVEFTGRKGN